MATNGISFLMNEEGAKLLREQGRYHGAVSFIVRAATEAEHPEITKQEFISGNPKGPYTHKFNVKSGDWVAEADKLAAHLGIPRASAIRYLVHTYLVQTREQELSNS